MSCLASNNVSSSSGASSLLPLNSSSTSRSPIDQLLSGIMTNFAAPNNPTMAMNVASTSQTQSSLNLFSDMISAVHLEESLSCAKCSLGSSSLSKCSGCCEILCDSCAQTRCGALPGKDHNLSRYPPKPITPPSGSSSALSSSPITVVQNFCELHHGQIRLFCQTCLSPLCTECLVADHTGHQLRYIEEAMENAKTTNRKLSIEARSAMLVVKEAIDNIQYVSDNVEAKSARSSSEIVQTVRRYVSALKDREVELLRRLDQTRQYKIQLLRSQMERLRLVLTKLSITSEMLHNCADSPNSMEILSVNEQSAKQLKQVSLLKSEFLPCEDDGIMFLPPDNGFLRAIATIGNLATSLLSTSKMMRTVPITQAVLNLPAFPKGIFHPLKNQTIHGLNSVVAKERKTRPIYILGGQGHTDGLFFRPWGVCCDKYGNIIVADRGNNRIQIFSSQGLFIRSFGKEGFGPVEFRKPAGIAVTPGGHLIIGDKDNHRIQVVQMDGTFLFAFGERGTENGQFYYPWDVACNSQGHIVVTDTRNHRIQIFNSEGVFLNKYGFEGTNMWKHFDAPRGVSFTPKGNIIVTDFNNHRLVIIDEGLRNAQFLGEEGGGQKQFLRPQGVICDDAGKVIVADSRNNRIQVVESNGTFLWKFGRTGEGVGEMDRPSGICLDPQGRIIVVDFGNHRVQIV